MNILYSGDNGIRDGILMSALSLTRSKEKINIYILTSSYKMMPIENEFALFLDKVLKEKNPLNSVTLFDIADIFRDNYPEKNKNTRFTAGCMLRLYADLVTALPEKILYLDADVLMLNEPSELFATDIENFEFAGVPDRYGKYFFTPFTHSYVNSGVLYLNLSEIRKSGLFEKARSLCKDKKMFLPDQSALNKLARKKLLLPRHFNEQKKTRDNTVFRHFTTFFRFLPTFKKITVKPWQIEKMHSVLREHRFDTLYQEYNELRRRL